MSKIFATLLAGVFLLLQAPDAHCDTPPPPAPAIHDQDILAYLQEVINWRHAIVDSDLPPDNARISLLKDGLKQSSQKALQDCFRFARAQSMLMEETPQDNGNTPKDANAHKGLYQKVAETQKRIDDAEARLSELSQREANGDHEGVVAEREKLNGELKVARANLELLNKFVTIFKAGGTDDTGLSGAINKLQGTILGDLNEQAPPNAKQETAKEDVNAPVKDDSIPGMVSGLFALSKKEKTVSALIRQTDELSASNGNLMKLLRTALQDAIREGYELADAPVAANRKSQDEHHRALDRWQAKYKSLSAVVVPLGEINSMLQTSGSNLKEWQGILEKEWNQLLSHFIVRFGILCASLLIPFIFLELAHKAIMRYVTDINRLRQLNIARQVLFVTLLILVIFLNFFTEFGSLATYAGFLTAGLAVALQTVLVSLTAHFFFFGRFGVRAGDRVTIAGVTGDVIQVGILRIYLMELIGEKGALRPSGQIVAFPNSVLFNATAFSKQVSGTHYTWNDIRFALDPSCDFTLANQKIMETVGTVYKDYKKNIERQHIALQQSTNLPVSIPVPRSEIGVKDNGLVCDVHYPVLIEHAPETYELILKKLITAFETIPNLKLVLSNPLRITVK